MVSQLTKTMKSLKKNGALPFMVQVTMVWEPSGFNANSWVLVQLNGPFVGFGWSDEGDDADDGHHREQNVPNHNFAFRFRSVVCGTAAAILRKRKVEAIVFLRLTWASMVLVIDNYDSFTYNLVQYLGEMTVDGWMHRLKDHATVAGKEDKTRKIKSKSNDPGCARGFAEVRPSTAEPASWMARHPVLLVLLRCLRFMENAQFLTRIGPTRAI